jgi:hypothetical protein
LSAATRWWSQALFLRDASVGDAPVAAGQPGDGAFDHRPVLPIGGLEFVAAGAFAMCSLQGVVFVQDQLSAPC